MSRPPIVPLYYVEGEPCPRCGGTVEGSRIGAVDGFECRDCATAWLWCRRQMDEAAQSRGPAPS